MKKIFIGIGIFIVVVVFGGFYNFFTNPARRFWNLTGSGFCDNILKILKCKGVH